MYLKVSIFKKNLNRHIKVVHIYGVLYDVSLHAHII